LLEEIGDVSHIGDYIKRAKDKNDTFRLWDLDIASTSTTTRAPSSCARPATRCWASWACTTIGVQLAMELERIALEDEYFVEKKLYPNVDFYSGIVQRAIGIPTRYVHANLRLGAHGGLGGAVERDDRRSEQKIGRPRQLFVGATKRNVVPVAKRE
jgi:citrate synthase